MLLTTHKFSFDCAKQLQFFSCQLAPYQRDRLFQLSFSLFTCQDCCWEGRRPTYHWMDELKVVPRMVQMITYELPLGGATVGGKLAVVGSKKKMLAACEGLDILNQRVMRGLHPGVRTMMTGEVYLKELNDVQRAAFDRILREGSDRH